MYSDISTKERIHYTMLINNAEMEMQFAEFKYFLRNARQQSPKINNPFLQTSLLAKVNNKSFAINVCYNLICDSQARVLFCS